MYTDTKYHNVEDPLFYIKKSKFKEGESPTLWYLASVHILFLYLWSDNDPHSELEQVTK